MEREERIARYERMLDRAELAAGQMEEALRACDAVRGDLEELERYYTGPEWKEDFEADEAGMLPAGLKRGVLSEDGIDAVLERFGELNARRVRAPAGAPVIRDGRPGYRQDADMKIIVINGPMGVGKTAAGRAIAEKYPGTAFIDGDWCMDLHPFVGSREAKEMAIDNILHMAGNYQRSSLCRMVVLAWLMDDAWVRRRLDDGLSALRAETHHVTLVCDRETLAGRWRNDRRCEWRTEEWLEVSLRSLEAFRSMENTIDTGGVDAEGAAKLIMRRIAAEEGNTEENRNVRSKRAGGEEKQ